MTLDIDFEDFAKWVSTQPPTRTWIAQDSCNCPIALYLHEQHPHDAYIEVLTDVEKMNRKDSKFILVRTTAEDLDGITKILNATRAKITILEDL